MHMPIFSGQIGYALVPMVARGILLGPDQPVILHMLDIEPAAEALNGVRMELVDSAFPLLKGEASGTKPLSKGFLHLDPCELLSEK